MQFFKVPVVDWINLLYKCSPLYICPPHKHLLICMLCMFCHMQCPVNRQSFRHNMPAACIACAVFCTAVGLTAVSLLSLGNACTLPAASCIAELGRLDLCTVQMLLVFLYCVETCATAYTPRKLLQQCRMQATAFESLKYVTYGCHQLQVYCTVGISV